MKKLIKIIGIFSILLLISCNKQEDDTMSYKYHMYKREIINENNYYSSNYAKEGNDYYHINIKHEEMGKRYYMKSIPSKYIVGIEAEYEFLFELYDIEEYVEYLPIPDKKDDSEFI